MRLPGTWSTARALTVGVVLGLCGCRESGTSETALNTRAVTLPDGSTIRAELKVTQDEMAMGMMYRDSLPPDHGMLFVHGSPGMSPYWMANCKIPLDIIWMDSDHKVVEISARTPPCPSGGPECPTYGGHAKAQYVLEIGGGEAARHQIHEGAVLQF